MQGNASCVQMPPFRPCGARGVHCEYNLLLARASKLRNRQPAYVHVGPTNGLEFDLIDQFARTVLTTLPSLLAQLLLRGFLGRVSSAARTE